MIIFAVLSLSSLDDEEEDVEDEGELSNNIIKLLEGNILGYYLLTMI